MSCYALPDIVKITFTGISNSIIDLRGLKNFIIFHNAVCQ